MDIKKLLGKRIQEIRKSKKLTQEFVAEKIGIEVSSLSNIENGKYFPNAENLNKILTVLEILPRDIFCFDSLAPIEELIEEMTNSMKNNEKLTRMMYKFYISVKH